MKKIIVLAVLLTFAASSAFAAATLSITTPLTKTTTGLTVYGATSGTATSTSPQIGKTSTGVAIGVFCNASGTGYALITQHMQGSKMFGSSYDSTSMYSKDVATKGSASPVVPTAITTADFATWTAL